MRIVGAASFSERGVSWLGGLLTRRRYFRMKLRSRSKNLFGKTLATIMFVDTWSVEIYRTFLKSETLKSLPRFIEKIICGLLIDENMTPVRCQTIFPQLITITTKREKYFFGTKMFLNFLERYSLSIFNV